jgi:ABC-2 type transport system ATP-binding protein
MNNIVAVHGLTFSYGTDPIVRAVDLNIPEGAVFGFAGPNGAGKSTTIKLLLGLLTPQRGTVRIFGSDMASHRSDVLKRIGSLVEAPSLYPHLTAEENLDLVRRVRRVPAGRIGMVLQETGIVHARKKKVKEFSLGMKQRLGIAMALLHQPQLLILDEPINGLDPEGIQEFRGFLKHLVAEHHVTVLLSSHILSELEQVATHVGIISRGSMRFQGTLDELKQRQQGNLILDVSDGRKAEELLRKKQYASRLQSDGTIAVPVTDRAAAAQINMLLVQSGIEVFQLRFEQPNLESVFLELIQNGGAA